MKLGEEDMPHRKCINTTYYGDKQEQPVEVLYK